MYHEKRYTKFDLCKACGGKCCQSMPGIYHPKDIERIYEEPISVDLLVHIFKEGLIALDQWEGDPRPEKTPPEALGHVYYLRPKRKGMENVLPDFGYIFEQKPCIWWTKESGCQLPSERMPYQCRALIPHMKKDHDNDPICSMHDEEKARKEDLSIAWISYGEMIEKAYELFQLGGQ